jgi:putative acetyltransferase
MDDRTIEIRSGEPADYAGLQALYTRPRLVHGTLQVPFTSQEVWRKRCLERPDNMHVLVACAGADIIGSGALVVQANARRRHVGELGLGVHDAWHRRGVGSRLLGSLLDLADRWLNLTRLELTVYTDNLAAIALYEKHGFHREGLLERYAFRDGAFADVFAMARLRA